MMKRLILIIIAILLVGTVQAKLCEDRPDHKISTNCTMMTPSIVGCPIYNYTVYYANETGAIAETGNLTVLGGGIYYWNFSLGEGEYIAKLCDGATREIIAEAEKDEMASFSVTFFVILLTSGVFLLPTLFKKKIKNEILATTLTGLCIVFGLLLLSLDAAMVATMADNAGLGVTQELFRYLFLINWSVYIAMVIVILSFGWRALHMWDQKKKAKDMGKAV